VRTGAGNGGDDVAAGGGSGKSWRVRRRAVGKGNRARVGRDGRVGVDPAGGGAAVVAERRPGGRLCTDGRRSRAGQHVLEEVEERGGVRGAYFEISKFQGLLSKLRFPTDVEV
jgi:hypothetical protein